MNDEFKGKTGKVKVMYVRSDDDSEKRSQNPRTGKGAGRSAGWSQGEGEGRRRTARQDDKSSPRGRDRNEQRSEASPWRTVSRVSRDPDTDIQDHGGISGKVLSILRLSAVNAQKKHVFMARMPVRRCSRVVPIVLSVPGLFRVLHLASKKHCAGWQQIVKRIML